MTRPYSLAFKQKMVERLTGKNAVSALDLSKETGVRQQKPNDNAYIESFNGKFRDECLNEHWFTSIAHAREVIEGWGVSLTGDGG